MPLPRRARLLPITLSLGLTAGLLAGCAAEPAAAPSGATQAEVLEIAEQLFVDAKMQAAVGQVIEDGTVVAEFALGEAITGEPATLDARWRNGAVAIGYLGIALLRLHERGVLDMDAPIAPYLPDFPDADSLTPRQLITMTSGIPDFVPNPEFQASFYENPFRGWTPDELLAFATSQPRVFAPGENWDYSHAGIVVLGLVMQEATGAPLAEILQAEVLDPLELTDTVADQSPRIPEPYLHGFTAERGVYEDATFWNPSWTLAEGSVQTTTVGDAARSFDAVIGRGELLSEASHAELISQDLVGFGAPLEDCRTCHTLEASAAYGIGVFLRGDTVAQTPLFGGFAGSVVTLPAARSTDGSSLTVAVAGTLRRDALADWSGRIPNRADDIAIAIMQQLRPDANVPDTRNPRP